MSASLEMKCAITEFDKIKPVGCKINPCSKPIYTLVKIEGWPYPIHYEFRFNETSGLFVELHAEHKRYSWIGEVFRTCSKDTPFIDGRSVEYWESRQYPNKKVWPSLSIALGPGALGTASAQVMLKLIEATRTKITRALGHWTTNPR